LASVMVEACPQLDIRKLNRRGLRFGWQFLTFTNGASVKFVGTAGALKFSYQASGIPVEYEVSVVKTRMHFGGHREWLVCPRCRKRFAILYLADRYFACRQCSGLFYQTNHEHRGGRNLIKAERLWKRAGHEFSGEGQRPRYMRRQTYNRLMERADEAYGASWDTPFLRQMMAKANR